MVLGKLPVPGRPTIWITVGQGPPALAECACLEPKTYNQVAPPRGLSRKHNLLLI